MEIILILSFLLFMGFFAAVGLSSIRVKENTTDDYLVAGRGICLLYTSDAADDQ